MYTIKVRLSSTYEGVYTVKTLKAALAKIDDILDRHQPYSLVFIEHGSHPGSDRVVSRWDGEKGEWFSD